MPESTVQRDRRPAFAYVVLAGGPRRGAIFQLRAGGQTLGRSSGSDIRVDDAAASAEHANLRWDGQAEVVLSDLGSENGTSVNGHRAERHLLRHDDVIRIGETPIVLKLVGAGQ